MSTPDSEITYPEAVRELDTIIAALEGDTLDIDSLADQVARAATLIEICRGRIERARVEVARVVDGLEGGPTPSDETPTGPT